MTKIGTPFTNSAMRVMLLGAGELGKEVVIELQRYGVEVIAIDLQPGATCTRLVAVLENGLLCK